MFQFVNSVSSVTGHGRTIIVEVTELTKFNRVLMMLTHGGVRDDTMLPNFYRTVEAPVVEAFGPTSIVKS